MQKKSKIKDEKGSMAVYVTVVLMTILVILTTLYSYTSLNRKSQLKTVVRVKEAYKNGIGELLTDATVSGITPLTLNNTVNTDLINYKIYGNSVQGENLIDITNAGLVGSAIGIDISNLIIGEKYVFSSNTIFESVKISSTSTGYNSVYELNTQEFTFEMARNESISSTATQYLFLKIDGSWISDASVLENYDIQIKKIPTPETPVEIQSVGDLVTDTADENYGKYKIPVTVKSENLIDITQLKPYSGTITLLENGLEYTGNWYMSTDMTLTSGETYYMNWEYESASDVTPFWRVKYTDGTYSGQIPRSKSITIPSDKQVEKVLIYSEMSSAVYTTKFTNIQLNEGMLKNYQPYSQTYDIYLDEPLRKVGDYKDYIDFEGKKVVRNIVSEFIDTVEFISSNDTEYKIFLSNISYKPFVTFDGNYTTAAYSIGFGISNKFQRSSYRYNKLGADPNLIQPYITMAGVNRVAYVFGDSSITTIEKAQEEIGEGFEVAYVLNTPIEETIELPTITTYEGKCIIKVDTSVKPSIEVTYKKLLEN